jgi:hypothetical protein
MACLQINIEGLGTFRGCKSFTAKGSRAMSANLPVTILVLNTITTRWAAP